MNKVLKIGGLVLLGLFLISVIFAVFTSTYRGLMMKTSLTPSDRTFKNSLSVSSSKSLGGLRNEMMEVAPLPSQMNGDNTESVTIADTVLAVNKKIIKNGNLSLKVDDTDASSAKISAIARNNSGEVFASNFYQSGSNVKSGTITVKVPVAFFEKTFGEIKEVASLVISESTTGQDVTEQYTDLRAQLVNAQAEEQSFIKILDQAVKIDDVLAVTRELARVRGTIERLQGSMKYLESQTDMSTIVINLTENRNIVVSDSSWRPLQVMKDSVNSLITGLQGFIDFVIRFIVTVLPFLIIWIIIIWGVYKIGRKIYLKVKTKNE